MSRNRRDPSRVGTRRADRDTSRVAPAIADRVVAVELLEPHPLNARTRSPAARAALRQSLEVNGQYRPVVARRLPDGRLQLLAGHGTVEAAASLGWGGVSADVHDGIGDEAAARIVAVDNRTSDLAGYDDEALAALLEAAGDLAGTGYAPADLDEILAGLGDAPVALTDADAVPDRPGGVPVSESGDVWLLGPHRLVCGDATDSAAVDAALAAREADAVWTDPPYGVDYTGGTGLKIVNDDLTAAELRDRLLVPAFRQAHRVLRPGGAFYVCAPSGRLETTFRLALEEAGFELRQQIAWVKDRFVLGRADYHGRHESVLFGWQLGAEPAGPPLYDPVHDNVLYGWKADAPHTWAGGRKQDTVWEIPRPTRSAVHPNMKPVSLVARAIENSTRPGAVVLDPFAGAGSTLIACHGLRRVAALVELDPAYCDVIARRWQEHTDTVPVLEATGGPHDFTQEP